METKEAIATTTERKSEWRRHTGEWSYVNKAIMAPMVRISTLPMRLLAYQYGADICYSEEMIDRKIAKCIRRVNSTTGRIEYHLPSGGLAFSTYEAEPVVMQLGTADSVLALKAANVVAGDVRAIDINMGCPKHFSLQGGMGAALLTKPELVRDILSTLTRNLSIPVTCKIRLLENIDDTMALVKAAEGAGVAAIAIHARHISDRPRNPARVHLVPDVISRMSVPAIYNGDVFYHDDIARMKRETGATSVMIARGAQWNASVFRSAGMLPVYDVCSDYIKIAERVGNVFANTKYAVMEMLKGHVGPVPAYQNVCNSRSYELLANSVTTVAQKSSCLTSPYVAPLVASLQAEADRRKQYHAAHDNTYAEAATAAAAATTTIHTTDDTSTTTTTTNTSTSAAPRAPGLLTTPPLAVALNIVDGRRKRRRDKQKDRRTRRLHNKYLKGKESTTTNTTSSSTTPSTSSPPAVVTVPITNSAVLTLSAQTTTPAVIVA